MPAGGLGAGEHRLRQGSRLLSRAVDGDGVDAELQPYMIRTTRTSVAVGK